MHFVTLKKKKTSVHVLAVLPMLLPHFATNFHFKLCSFCWRGARMFLAPECRVPTTLATPLPLTKFWFWLANTNLFLSCSRVILGYHDLIWLVRDYVAGGMFCSTPLGWDLCIFLLCLDLPDYPDPLSFFVLILQVTWLPFLSFVHCCQN